MELRISRDLIVELSNKVNSIGFSLIGPMDVYFDNQLVVNNTSVPESTLNNNHNSLNYHAVREAAAAGILRIGK